MAKRFRKRTRRDGVSRQVRPPAHPPFWQHDRFWGLILFLAVVVVYLPAWHAAFIWDDDLMLTANPCIIGPLGLKEIWTTSAADICPLTLTVFWAEHALWGLQPLPYHLVNIALQGGGSVILWRILRHLEIPGAWWGAALWALHPVQVESVAWVAEMKNTLSGFFYLLAIFFFVKGLKTRDDQKRNGRWRGHALTLVCAALAMAAKSTTVMLPLVLGLCGWWVEGKWEWRRWINLAPVFLFSLMAGAVSLWTQHAREFADAKNAPSLAERLIAGGEAIWFYLGKLLAPYPLIAVYPRWEIDPSRWFSWLPLTAAIALLVLLWLKRASWSRPFFFAYGYFLAALLPALGLVNMTYFRFSFVADHFQYLADMGPLALLGAGFARLPDLVRTEKKWLPAAIGGALLLILGTLTWTQARIYENEQSLWPYTLAWNPNCWIGYNNLGFAAFRQAHFDEAIALYGKALKINPLYAEADNNLGNALFKKGRLDEAMELYQKSIEINPRYAQSYNDLGAALFAEGRLDTAMAQEQKAVEINPLYAEAYNNIGNVLFQKNRVDEAIEKYRKALEISPRYAQADNNLAVAFFHKGDPAKALSLLQEALQLQPDYADAQNNLAKIQAMMAKGAAPK